MSGAFETMLHQMKQSDIIVISFLQTELECPMCYTQLGLAVALGKPIIAVVANGVQLSESLCKVVTRFIEADSDRKRIFDSLKEAVDEIMQERSPS